MPNRFSELAKIYSKDELGELTKLAISRKRHRIELWLTWALETAALVSAVLFGVHLLNHFSSGLAIRNLFFLLVLGLIWMWLKIVVLSVFWVGHRAVVREAARAMAPARS
jgi:hypothetical protein